jgi:hypothetical protein
MDDEEFINEAVPETIAPEQAAWAAYVAKTYLDRDSIGPAHRAFLAGYKVGWSEGLNDGVNAQRLP